MLKFEKQKNEKIILISNIGSASRKYIVYGFNQQTKKNRKILELNFDGKEYYPKVKLTEAMYAFFDLAKSEIGLKISDIDIIAERVVAVGEYFLEDKYIDEVYIEKLEKVLKYNSLHTKSLLNEIRQLLLIRKVCLDRKIKCRFKLIGISDSTFHNTISAETYTYAVRQVKGEEKFRRYGYHGISMSEVNYLYGKDFNNIISIHLGGGGSVTAIQKEKSIYNSFGMTAVSGIINLTRSGDIDPLVVVGILKSNQKSFRFLSSENYLFTDTAKELYENSGLYVLTGEKDMRDILENLKSKNIKVKLENEFALNVYLNRINESVGSALSHLGKVEAIVLTGAILEKSEVFRNKLIKKISWLKVKKANIFVAKTEEDKEMLRLLIEGKFV